MTLKICFAAALFTASSLSAQNLEVFEKNARPLFVETCQSCHNQKLKSGGLDLSSVEGMKEAAAGGFFGTAAEPDNSPILQALSYEGRVKMPPQGKLPPETIAAIREWVTAGAPAPAAATSARQRLCRNRRSSGRHPRRDHGSGQELLGFQSHIGHPAPPTVDRKDWAPIQIDRFILANLEKNGLQPAPPADKNHAAAPRHFRSDRPSSH